MNGKLLFEEKQSFVGTWSWYLVIGVAIFIIWLFGRGFVQQIIYGEPWGDRPMSDTGLIIFSVANVILMLGVFGFLTAHRLTLSITPDTIRYVYIPYFFKPKTLRKTDVSALEVRKYNALFEYGGWGYRFGFGKGNAYTVSGNIGLQLKLTNGKKLLIGTQKEESMKRAIRTLKENWGMN